MVTHTNKCTDCGEDASIAFGQAIAGAKLAWFQSTRCSNCGMTIEADDYGLPPNDIRAEIMETKGRWGLQIAVEGPKRLVACKILHCDLNTTMEEVAPMKNRMPGVVYTGTKTEMEWLHGRLAQFGIASTVLQQPDDANAQSIDIARLDSIAFEDRKQR